MSENQTFNTLGKLFQLKVLKEVIKDKDFAIQLSSVLKEEYFTTNATKWIARFILKFIEEYHEQPSLSTIGIDVKEIEAGNLKDKITQDLFTIKNIDRKDYQYIRDRALEFCRKQNMKSALKESIEILKQENKNCIDKIRTIVSEASIAGATSNIGVDYMNDLDNRMIFSKRKTVPTGWTPIDIALDGGVGVGELAAIMAPTGIGKSFALTNIAGYNVLNGRNVIYYTLETADIIIANRTDAYITELPIDDIEKKKEEVKKILKEKVKGRLIIKQYPTKSASISTFYAHLQLLDIKGFTPDLIIIDYADLIKGYSAKSGSESYFLTKDLYQQLRRLAGEIKVPIWTATQTNKSAYEQEIIGVESAAEGSGKGHELDIMLSFSRTTQDKQSDVGRFFLAKSRVTKDALVFPAIVHLDKSRIIVHESSKNNEFLLNKFKNNSKIKEQRAKMQTTLDNILKK